MVRDVDEDARGIIAPDVGLQHFRLERHAPSARVARFVDRYWVASWDLRGRDPYPQRVLAHPVVNVVFAPEGAAIHGVATRITTRTLEGVGWALGVMFRPAGFRPFLGRPLSTIVDAVLPLDEVFADAVELAAAVRAAGPDAAAGVVDAALGRLVPADRQPSEDTTAIVERIAADPAMVRVEALAAEEGLSTRQLQRRFADHVGLSPKTVIRRYRLYEAAERARHGPGVDWAALAVELGHSDQAHLTRDFSAVIGMPPQRYTRAAAGAAAARGAAG